MVCFSMHFIMGISEASTQRAICICAIETLRSQELGARVAILLPFAPLLERIRFDGEVGGIGSIRTFFGCKHARPSPDPPLAVGTLVDRHLPSPQAT
jgi:hypothetical protein